MTNFFCPLGVIQKYLLFESQLRTLKVVWPLLVSNTVRKRN